MRTTLLAALLILSACSKKKDEKPAEPASGTPGSAVAKPEEPAPKPAEKKLPDVEMVDHDLAPFGKAFEGWVVTAPKDAKLELDDPSRHIVLSEEDFVAVSEAEFWEDAVNEKALASDKDNQNIKKVSDTEYRWERTPPLGKSWLVDVLVKIGKTKYSCGTGITGTFHSAAMADRIATICKSIRKK